MRQAQTYKPSNTFSFVGFILMFISMLVAGALLSWLYVILQNVIPSIYLCILITILFGAAIGGIGAVFVKIYKIRYPFLAIIATLIAMLFVYYFHWCVYVAKDYDKNIYDSMKKYNASTTFLGVSDSEINDDVIESFVAAHKAYPTRWKSDEFSILGIKNGYEDILGSTDEEIRDSIRNIAGKNCYQFIYEYRKLPEHSIGYLLVHPGDLWEDISNINKDGRWTTTSSRSSYSSSNKTSKDNVKGAFLWLVWLGEMILMFAPAVAIVSFRAGSPFIEQDNDWAITDKPQTTFKFVDPFPGNSNGEKQFKATFLNDIDSIFTLQPLLPQMGSLNTFYTVNYCHSKFYTENYLTVLHTRVTNARNNQRATTTIAKKILVDANYIATLHAMFNLPVPANCPGTNMFAQQQEQPQQNYDQQSYEQPQQDYNQQSYEQHDYQPQQDYAPQEDHSQQGYEQQNYDQPQQQYQSQYQPQYQPQYQQPQQGNAPQEDYSSGDMDGIDTSNIDLSSLDNMKH